MHALGNQAPKARDPHLLDRYAMSRLCGCQSRICLLSYFEPYPLVLVDVSIILPLANSEVYTYQYIRVLNTRYLTYTSGLITYIE